MENYDNATNLHPLVIHYYECDGAMLIVKCYMLQYQIKHIEIQYPAVTCVHCDTHDDTSTIGLHVDIYIYIYIYIYMDLVW